jgi:hypothetical protein
MQVIGYQYDADYHCINCAIIRWPLSVLKDGAKHEVHPLFDTDEWYANAMYEGKEYEALHCSDCGRLIDEWGRVRGSI